MALGSTQPLVKMSTRYIPGSKGGRCVGLTTSPPSCAECHQNLAAYNSWNPLGHTGPVTGLLYFLLVLGSVHHHTHTHIHTHTPCVSVFPGLTFTGPCIVLYSYTKSQQYVLFLKFILVFFPR